MRKFSTSLLIAFVAFFLAFQDTVGRDKIEGIDFCGSTDDCSKDHCCVNRVLNPLRGICMERPLVNETCIRAVELLNSGRYLVGCPCAKGLKCKRSKHATGLIESFIRKCVPRKHDHDHGKNNDSDDRD